MAVCANCDHDVAAHGTDGCFVGSALADTSQHCKCPMTYPRPSDRRCRCCGHTLGWHHTEEGGDGRCSRCEVCDGFLDGEAHWMEACPAKYLAGSQNYQCRRKEDHDGPHSDGHFRWANHTSKAKEKSNVATFEQGLTEPVANPDRISYKGAVNFADVPKVADTQVGGEHYRQTGIQPWDIIDAWGLDFYAGNALKYLYRAGRKGPKVEDLKKARHYIDKMIEKEES